jgi:hypothetical protein
MAYKRHATVKLTLDVDLDIFEGFGFNASDFVDLMRRQLNEGVSHYNPKLVVDSIDTTSETWSEQCA